MSIIANGIKSKSIGKMIPKRTISNKKHNRKTVHRKLNKPKPTMSQSQNGHVCTHKSRAQRTVSCAKYSQYCFNTNYSAICTVSTAKSSF